MDHSQSSFIPNLSNNYILLLLNMGGKSLKRNFFSAFEMSRKENNHFEFERYNDYSI